MKKKYLTGLLSCILVVTMLSGCAEKDAEGGKGDVAGQEPGTTPSLETGAPLAQVVFEGRDMEENVVSSDIFSQTKLTMVNVWATYCNPCLSEMPGLGELAAEYDPQDFRLIGIVSDVQEGASEKALGLVADLIEQTGADYSHLLLNESIYNALLSEVTAVPTTFFIDENGVILDTVIGAMDKSAWKEKINGYLEEK